MKSKIVIVLLSACLLLMLGVCVASAQEPMEKPNFRLVIQGEYGPRVLATELDVNQRILEEYPSLHVIVRYTGQWASFGNQDGVISYNKLPGCAVFQVKKEKAIPSGYGEIMLGYRVCGQGWLDVNWTVYETSNWTIIYQGGLFKVAQ